MNNLLPIGSIDIVPALLQLKRNPQFWNLYTNRTENYTSPHSGISDIWIRYRDYKDFNGNWADFNEEHDPIWYEASDAMPAFKDIAFQIMSNVRGERLGGILITRIPPGAGVAPHIDASWHAAYYDKYAVQLESHPDQAFCFDEGEYSASPGEVYWFNNQVTHWVRNDSPIDRITLIVCIRSDRRQLCHLH